MSPGATYPTSTGRIGPSRRVCERPASPPVDFKDEPACGARSCLKSVDGVAEAGRYPRVVGFNPYRPQTRRRSDYVIVIAAFLVIAVILLWALIPR
jgi:hypothetical protein